MSKNNYGYMAKIGVDTSELVGGLKDIGTQTQSIDRDMKALDKSISEGLKNGADVTEAQASKMELLSQKYELATQKLDGLMSVYDQMSKARDTGLIDEQEWARYIAQVQTAENSVIALENAMDEAANGTSTLLSEAGSAADETDGLFGGLTVTLGDVRNIVGDVINAVKSAIGEIQSLVDEAAKAGDTIDKSSQRLGLSQKAYQEWEYVLSQNGADISALTTGVNKLNSAYDDLKSGTESATEKFARLGLSLKDVESMTQEELFGTVISQLQSIEDESERNAAANDLLGKSYMQLIPLLNQDAESTQALLDKASEFGMVMSEEAVTAAVNYTDATDTMTRALEGLKNELSAGALPALTDFNNTLAEMIANIGSGDVDGESIQKSIEQMARDIADEMDYIIEVFGELGETVVPAILDGIEDNIGGVAEKGAEITATLVSAMLRGLPDVVNCTVELIEGFVKGWGDNFPMLANTAAETVLKLAGEIIGHVDDVINAAVELASGIGQGIVNATPKILAEIPVLMVKLVEEIIKGIPQLVVGFGAVCESMADSLVNYDWTAVVGMMMDNLISALSNAQRHVQVWLDNTFSDGKLYGGDINNVAETQQIAWMRSGADDIIKTVDKVSAEVKAAYDAGREEIGFSWADYYAEMYPTEEAVDTAVEKTEDAGEEVARAVESSTGNIKTATYKGAEEVKESKKEISDAFKSFYEGLETDLAHGDIDEAGFYSKLADMLGSSEEYLDPIYNKYWTALSNYNKKIADAERKAAEEKAKAQEKAAEEEAKRLKKALEDKAKADKKAYDEWVKETDKTIADINKKYAEVDKELAQKSDNYAAPTVTKQKDKDGNEVVILDDLKKKIKVLEDYKTNMQKLLAAGMPESLKADILKMSIDERAAFVEALAKANYKLYFSDWSEYQAAADSIAMSEVAEKEQAVDQYAADKTKEIFDKMPDYAKSAGNDTAMAYLQGIYDGLKDEDWKASFDSGMTETAAHGQTQSTASVVDAVKALNNIINANVSGTTNVTVNVDGEKYFNKAISGKQTADIVADV